jgi:hypothetical protein
VPVMRLLRSNTLIVCEFEHEIDGFPGVTGEPVSSLMIFARAHRFKPEDSVRLHSGEFCASI